MKVLFRNYHSDENGKQILTYDWWNCNVKESTNDYFALVDPETKSTKRIYKSSVIKVKGDVRSKYVKCDCCREIILNTPEMIDKHYRKQESKMNCLTCRYMDFRTSANGNQVSKIKINDDGTVFQTLKREGYLQCGYAYERCSTATTADYKYKSCKYRKCRLSGVVEAFNKDIFSECPKFFDRFVTEKQLINCGWIFNSAFDYGRMYKTPGIKNVIYAYTDINGIVTQFDIEHRNSTYSFMYSPKEERPFYMVNSCIRNDYINWKISATKIEAIKKKLNKLYGIEDKVKKGNK